MGILANSNRRIWLPISYPNVLFHLLGYQLLNRLDTCNSRAPQNGRRCSWSVDLLDYICKRFSPNDGSYHNAHIYIAWYLQQLQLLDKMVSRPFRGPEIPLLSGGTVCVWHHQGQAAIRILDRYRRSFWDRADHLLSGLALLPSRTPRPEAARHRGSPRQWRSGQENAQESSRQYRKPCCARQESSRQYKKHLYAPQGEESREGGKIRPPWGKVEERQEKGEGQREGNTRDWIRDFSNPRTSFTSASYRYWKFFRGTNAPSWAELILLSQSTFVILLKILSNIFLIKETSSFNHDEAKHHNICDTDHHRPIRSGENFPV